MRKEYKEAIISGIVTSILVTIVLYLIQGKVAWAYLLTFPIFTFIIHYVRARYKLIVFVSDKVRPHFIRKEKDQLRE